MTLKMSGKLPVTMSASSNKLSVASNPGRKRCSLACNSLEKRVSVGGRSGSEDSVYEYEGPEFIIHKEDFLIHNKKVSSLFNSFSLHITSDPLRPLPSLQAHVTSGLVALSSARSLGDKIARKAFVDCRLFKPFSIYCPLQCPCGC